MTTSWEQAKALQRPLPDGSLDIVARGVKKDGNGGEEARPAQDTLLYTRIQQSTRHVNPKSIEYNKLSQRKFTF